MTPGFSFSVHDAVPVVAHANQHGTAGAWVTMECSGTSIAAITMFLPIDQAQAIAEGFNKAAALAVEAAKQKRLDEALAAAQANDVADEDALDEDAQRLVDAANPPPAGYPDDWSF